MQDNWLKIGFVARLTKSIDLKPYLAVSETSEIHFVEDIQSWVR